MPRSSPPKSDPPRVRRGNAEDAQRLRAALLDAAADLFHDQGLDGVSMRAVAARVGVSPMTPYRYFIDKADLLRGLWERVLVQLRAALIAAVAVPQGARARKRAQIEAFLGFWEARPDEFRLVYQTQGMSQRSMPEGSGPVAVYTDLLELVREATLALAREIGAPATWVRLADDLVFAMELGYLQAAMVNRRYPWSPLPVLRVAMVEHTLEVLERCLLQGPVPDPRS